MKRFYFAWLVLVLATNLARAAVHERDWKVPGDGLLTYDDVNGREWLDLTESDISKFSDPYVENAIAEVALGGMFEGFTLAMRADAAELAQSAGIDVTTDSFSTNESASRALVELMGPTFARPSEGAVFAVGWLDEFIALSSPFCPCRTSAELAVNPRSGANGMAGLFNGGDLSSFGYHAGLMLYRMVVPEPPSAVAIAICFLAMLFSKRRH